ncbi:hypothetical protein [Kibdelosporangium philippinense]
MQRERHDVQPVLVIRDSLGQNVIAHGSRCGTVLVLSWSPFKSPL